MCQLILFIVFYLHAHEMTYDLRKVTFLGLSWRLSEHIYSLILCYSRDFKSIH